MRDDAALGTLLRERLPRGDGPGPDLDRVLARAGRLRLRRRVVAGVAGVIVAAGLVVPLAFLAPLGGGPPRPADTLSPAVGRGTLVQGHGLSIRIPEGWDGRVYYNPDAGARVLQLANVDLKPVPPGGPEDDLASMTRRELGPNEAVIVIWDLLYCPCAGFPQSAGPVAIQPGPGSAWEGADPAHATDRVSFERDGRYLDLRADFGSSGPDPALVREVNDALATLKVEPARGTSRREGWILHRDIEGGLSIETPAAWSFREDPTPAVGYPRTRFFAGTVPQVLDGGDCMPSRAIEAVGGEDVLLWVIEYDPPDSPYEFPVRPTRLALGALQGPFECVGREAYMLRFRDRGRFLQVFALVGPEASQSVLDDVRDAVDSIRVERAGDDPCTAGGPWTDCPDAAWAYEVAQTAGFAPNGDTGSALVFAGHGAEFYLWAFEDPDPGAPPDEGLTEIGSFFVQGQGDVVVYGEGEGLRLVWEVQGAQVWVEAGPHEESALPKGDALAKLVVASLTVVRPAG